MTSCYAQVFLEQLELETTKSTKKLSAFTQTKNKGEISGHIKITTFSNMTQYILVVSEYALSSLFRIEKSKVPSKDPLIRALVDED